MLWEVRPAYYQFPLAVPFGLEGTETVDSTKSVSLSMLYYRFGTVTALQEWGFPSSLPEAIELKPDDGSDICISCFSFRDSENRTV